MRKMQVLSGLAFGGLFLCCCTADAGGLDLGEARLKGRPPETLIACGGGSVWLLSPEGKVEWRKDGCGNVHRAIRRGDKVYWSNGNVWVTDVTTLKTEIFYSPAPRDGTYGFCITDEGTMVVSENATDYVVELKLGTKEVVARFMGDPKGIDGKMPGAHHHYRMVRKTASGTYLVCCSGAHVVREYDASGALLWEQPAPDLAFEAVRRANGNTLVSHLGAITEYTPDHKVAWSFSCADAPELKLANLCGIHERANGNLVVGTYANGTEDGSRTTAFEVTREKKIVWSYAPAGRRLSTMTVLPCGAPLRMVSYNVHHCGGMDKKVDCARTAAAISRERPDFAGIQEVDRGVRRSGRVDQPAELARLTGMHATFAKAIPLRDGEYGVAVLSREKPLSVRRTPLPGPEPRVLLLCEFTNCWFGSTHLDSGKRPGDVEPCHVLSARIIRDEVATCAAEKPVFLAGDWNAVPGSPAHREMCSFLKVVSDERKPANGNLRRVIDYLAVDAAHAKDFRVLSAAVTLDLMTSDHKPVVVSVERAR